LKKRRNNENLLREALPALQLLSGNGTLLVPVRLSNEAKLIPPSLLVIFRDEG
jgi:hypothetical protein